MQNEGKFYFAFPVTALLAECGDGSSLVEKGMCGQLQALRGEGWVWSQTVEADTSTGLEPRVSWDKRWPEGCKGGAGGGGVPAAVLAAMPE